MRRFVFVLFIAVFACPAKATEYTVRDLFSGSELGSVAKAINNNGDVIGNKTSDQGTEGFLLQNGNLIVLDGWPHDINDHGTVVGNKIRPDKPYSSGAEMWFPGAALWGLFPSVSAALGVNNSGLVVGWSATLQGDRPFIWDPPPSVEDQLELPTNGQPGQALCINDANVVGGSVTMFVSNQVGWVSHPAIWSWWGTEPNVMLDEIGDVYAINSRGDFITTGGWYHRGTVATQILAPDEGYLMGINDLGQIVGHRSVIPFVWSEAAGFQDLPGGIGAAYDINNSGVIVGRLDEDGGSSRAVEWNVTPEPGSVLVLGGGLLGLLGFALNRRR